MYNERVLLEKVPEKFAMPICFFIYGRVTGGSSQNVTCEIVNPDGTTGQTIEWESVEGPAAGRDEPAMLIWKLLPWRAEGAGQYKLRLKQGGKPKTIYEFDVAQR
jgi:hypothetical protein